jgi:hypothetical protein
MAPAAEAPVHGLPASVALRQVAPASVSRRMIRYPEDWRSGDRRGRAPDRSTHQHPFTNRRLSDPVRPGSPAPCPPRSAQLVPPDCQPFAPCFITQIHEAAISPLGNSECRSDLALPWQNLPLAGPLPYPGQVGGRRRWRRSTGRRILRAGWRDSWPRWDTGSGECRELATDGSPAGLGQP